MLFGKNPGLKRKPRRVRRKRDEVFVLRNHAIADFALLLDNIAENAALLIDVILLGAFNFLGDVNRNDGQRNQLRMCVLHRCSSGVAVILENQNIFETPVFF